MSQAAKSGGDPSGIGGSTAENLQAQDLLNQKAVGEQLAQETRHTGGGVGGACTKALCCGVCGKPNRNSRPCQEAEEPPNSSISCLIICAISLGFIIVPHLLLYFVDLSSSGHLMK